MANFDIFLPLLLRCLVLRHPLQVVPRHSLHSHAKGVGGEPWHGKRWTFENSASGLWSRQRKS